MYLKRIEMQGFKSFASKIKMEFHDGVTGIVGPNGSGKSNVADAVRWVLGEQSAKQLRGGNMQDVIFAGTESRKPLGFASVSITLDNADHDLNIDYPEVTVTRRLYRSGESEYLMNNASCRLRDIQELFYDTGIGKEGYSIIGQGQIDRIISDKPEDRRELFDEAVGIVKFKRRKMAALKKLDGEEQNMLRITDILTELTKQVGPLERQSEKAKIYLAKREELKERDIALFAVNDARTEEQLKDFREKNKAAGEELSAVSGELDKTKQEYDEVEKQMEELDQAILEIRSSASDSALKKQQLENQIRLLEEQIKGAASNRVLYEEQIQSLENGKKERGESIEALNEEKKELKTAIEGAAKDEEQTNIRLADIRRDLEEKKKEESKINEELYRILDGRSSLQGQIERYQAMNEQIQVRYSAMSARVFKLEEQKAATQKDREANEEAYRKICEDIEKYEKDFSDSEAALAGIKKKMGDTNSELAEYQAAYHRQLTLLESLTNIAERYEGYGNSVKKVMELKDSNPGIHGVVAELISTEKKYETAIETALGGNLQNIVTDNEATAKYLIEYLKRGKYGRATFLPLTSMNTKDEKETVPDDEGIIGTASDLISCSETYRGVVSKLLGKTYVVDTIDHAIAIGRKHKHKLRMVTLEGEYFNPGGSISGGAYKNNSNLLGRKRQIEELEAASAASKKNVSTAEAQIVSLKEERNGIREEQNKINEALKQLYIDKNTAGVRLKVAEDQSREILLESEKLREDQEKLNAQIGEINEVKKSIDGQMSDSTGREKELDTLSKAAAAEIEQLSTTEKEILKTAEDQRINSNALLQKEEFLNEKAEALRQEIEKADEDIRRLNEAMEADAFDVDRKRDDIDSVQKTIAAAEEYMKELDSNLEESLSAKDKLMAVHKDFFAKREELTDHRTLLEKECFRLENAIEKLESDREGAIAHLWEEYEITPLQITGYENDTRTRGELTREIAAIRKDIRDLGSVNVNAIEEYKEVKERHTFLSAQYEDIVKSAESLRGIIAELDKGMKKQFNEKFADIQKEFNIVFRQLFGGGKGTLELLDADDVLETGVRIIAQPPGKKLQNMMQLSGGEKALTAIALLFAIQNLKPSPFCLLDEIEAALDESNVDRFAAYLNKLKINTQFIVITHRRGTMNCTDRLYGITMQEKGISTMVSVDLVEGDLT